MEREIRTEPKPSDWSARSSKRSDSSSKNQTGAKKSNCQSGGGKAQEPQQLVPKEPAGSVRSTASWTNDEFSKVKL